MKMIIILFFKQQKYKNKINNYHKRKYNKNNKKIINYKIFKIK